MAVSACLVERHLERRRRVGPLAQRRRPHPAGTPFGPRRSTGSSPSTLAAHGSPGSSSASGTPGSSGERSARSRSCVSTSTGGLLEPVVRERPAVDDADGVEPLLELCSVEQRARGHGLDRDRLVDERADDRGRVAVVEKSVALGVDAAGRRRVEDDRAADGRLGPEHDTVAARRDDRGGEAQLRVALAHAHDARGNPARPVVHREARAARDRRKLVSATSSR